MSIAYCISMTLVLRGWLQYFKFHPWQQAGEWFSKYCVPHMIRDPLADFEVHLYGNMAYADSQHDNEHLLWFDLRA